MTTIKEALLLSLHEEDPKRSFGAYLKKHWEDSIQREPNGPYISPRDQLSNLAEESPDFFKNPFRVAELTLTCYLSPLEVREALWIASLLGELAYPLVLRDWQLAIAYLFSPHSSVRIAAATVVKNSQRDFFGPLFKTRSLQSYFEEQLQKNIYVGDVLQMDAEFVPGDRNKLQAWWQPDDDTPPRRRWSNRVSCRATTDYCNTCLVCMATLSVVHLQPKPAPTPKRQPEKPDAFVAALPIQVCEALTRAGYNTRKKVEKLSKARFLEIPNLGQKSYALVQLKLGQK